MMGGGLKRVSVVILRNEVAGNQFNDLGGSRQVDVTGLLGRNPGPTSLRVPDDTPGARTTLPPTPFQVNYRIAIRSLFAPRIRNGSHTGPPAAKLPIPLPPFWCSLLGSAGVIERFQNSKPFMRNSRDSPM